MSLEASIVLLDNSDYARNGDLFHNRWGAQLEALQLVANAKLEANAENGVGLILSAGKQVQLLMTPTNDSNQLIATCENQQLRGSIKFSVALYIAQLTLKHRINKKQATRIIAFVASPVEEEEAALVSLAKKLKKNNIAVDIINFGEQNEEHLKKLEVFINTVKKGSNSTLANIKPGSQGVFDQVLAILQNNVQGYKNYEKKFNKDFQANQPVPGQQQPQPAAGLYAEYGGIDPNVDPELAMAMKMSLEEEKTRVQQPSPPPPPPPQQEQPQQPAKEQQQPVQVDAMQEEQLQTQEDQDIDEEELYRKAQQMSLEENVPLIQKQQDQQKEEKVEMMEKKEEDEFLQDEDFVRELLESAQVELEEDALQKLLKKKDDRSDDKPK